MCEAITVPNCACGKPMKIMGGGKVFACLNCDGLQPQESGGVPKPRIKSPQDKAFDAEHRDRMAKIYSKQPKGPSTKKKD